MALLSIKNIGKIYNQEFIYENISFEVSESDKIALIGKNGVGKSTVLKQIMEIIDIDAGDIVQHHNFKIGYLSQAVIESLDHTIYEEMLIPFKDVKNYEIKLKELLKKLETNPHDEKLLTEYGRMEHYLDSIGGYEYELKIKTILNNLNFTENEQQRKISSFSGGERTKIAFARLLVDNYDLLILDEPTNHLDISTINWLEGYLKKYPGAIVLVSHDRYFIDKVCNKIIEISPNGCEEYHGNYEKFLSEKEHRFQERKKQWKLRQEEIDEKTLWIAKNKAKNTKATQAKDMQKKLDKILEIHGKKPVQRNRQMKLKFTDFNVRNDKIFQLNKIDVGYETKTLVEDVSFEVYGKDRIAILGDNGTGKSTILKIIKGDIKPQDGKINWFKKLNIGYFDQNHFQEENISVFDYISNDHPLMTNKDVRTHLANFLFTSHDVEKKISQLSGGERVRLIFALLILEKYDILLLDEPTNHLDIETKEVLENGIKTFPGTIVFVSHDRYFINKLANKIVFIKNKKATFFDGTYDNFMGVEACLIPEKNKKTRKNDKIKIKNYKSQLRTIEKQIFELENLYKENEEMTYLKEVYEDPIHLKEIEKIMKDLESKIDFAYTQYEELLEGEEE